MATSLGRVYLSGCNYELAYDLLSQSTADNTSSVRLYGILHVTNNYVSWSSGSASVHTSGLQGIGTYYSKGDHTLITRDFTFTHDGNGNFSTYIGASLSTTFVSGDCGGTMTLPKINRYPILTSGMNFNDEENPVYNITAFNTFPIRVKLEAGGDTQLIIRDLDTKGSINYTLELTEEERNILRNLCRNSKTLNVTETVCAMNGNTELNASFKSYKMTIVNGNPTFTQVYEDTNATTIAITNNNQQIIRNNSTLEVNLSNMVALKYATLSNAKVIIDGITYNGTISGSSCTINVGTLNLSSNTNADVVVTDSRGLNTTHQMPITILDWQLPTGIITLERQSNYYSATDIKVDANYSSLDNKNQITIKTRYKKTSDSTYGSYVDLQDNVTSILTLDNLYSWDVQVLIEDLIGSTTYNLSLGIGLPILFIDRLKRSVGIECFPNDDNSIEINGINVLNKIKDIYSTNETLTNKIWVDNKPIYRKVLYTNTTTGIPNDLSLNITNLDEITYIDVLCLQRRSAGGYQYKSSYYQGDNDNWRWWLNDEKENNRQILKFTGTLPSNNRKWQVIVEYTKTTD